MDDLWQQRYGIAAFDGAGNPDSDARINLVESLNFSDPTNSVENTLGMVWITDTNPADGLADEWQQRYGITSAEAFDDPDQDGRKNIEESIVASHPREFDLPWRAASENPGSNTNGAGTFVITLPQTLPTMRYRLQTSEDLLEWNLATIADASFWGNGQSKSLSIDTVGAERGFFRFLVDSPDSDFDGLGDWIEIFVTETDADAVDSDGDDWNDSEEWENDTDPNDPTDRPPPLEYESESNVVVESRWVKADWNSGGGTHYFTSWQWRWTEQPPWVGGWHSYSGGQDDIPVVEEGSAQFSDLRLTPEYESLAETRDALLEIGNMTEEGWGPESALSASSTMTEVMDDVSCPPRMPTHQLEYPDTDIYQSFCSRYRSDHWHGETYEVRLKWGPNAPPAGKRKSVTRHFIKVRKENGAVVSTTPTRITLGAESEDSTTGIGSSSSESGGLLTLAANVSAVGDADETLHPITVSQPKLDNEGESEKNEDGGDIFVPVSEIRPTRWLDGFTEPGSEDLGLSDDRDRVKISVGGFLSGWTLKVGVSNITGTSTDDTDDDLNEQLMTGSETTLGQHFVTDRIDDETYSTFAPEDGAHDNSHLCSLGATVKIEVTRPQQTPLSIEVPISAPQAQITLNMSYLSADGVIDLEHADAMRSDAKVANEIFSPWKIKVTHGTIQSFTLPASVADIVGDSIIDDITPDANGKTELDRLWDALPPTTEATAVPIFYTSCEIHIPAGTIISPRKAHGVTRFAIGARQGIVLIDANNRQKLSLSHEIGHALRVDHIAGGVDMRHRLMSTTGHRWVGVYKDSKRFSQNEVGKMIASRFYVKQP